MNELINNYLTALNDIGRGFCSYTVGIFVQSSVLIVLLLIIDFLLRRRVRAVFRYCVWMLVFVKLVLPPTLCLPTGIGYWFGNYLSTNSPVLERPTNVVQHEPVSASTPGDFALSAEGRQIQPSNISPETAAPVTSDVSSLEPLTWQAILFLLWLLGVLFISVLLIQRMSFVKRLVAQSEPAKNRLLDVLNECRRQIGVHRNIELRLSNNISSPAVCGLSKPIVLMPVSIIEKLSSDKLRAVLIHELAHIKRGDLWVNSMQTFLQVVYFYNPFVWLANAVVRRIREQAVDEMVLVALGSGAKSYSNTLIDIAEMAFWRANFALRLVGVVESKKALHTRIKFMLSRPIPKSAKVGVFGLLAVMGMAAVLLPMTAAEYRGQKPALSEVEGTDDRVEKQFAATLPNGVTVELVGVCEHPSEGKKWWKPDGSEIEIPEFKAYCFPWPKTSGLKLEGAILFRLSNYENVSVPEIEFSKGDDGFKSVIAKDGTLITYVNSLSNEVMPEVIDIRLAVCASEFKKSSVGKYNRTTRQIYVLDDHSTVILHPLRIDGSFGSGREMLVADLTYKQNNVEFRLLYEIKNGGTKTAREVSSLGAPMDEIKVKTFQIAAEAEEIKDIILQYRSYEWLTFRNVSLRPAAKTDVQVEENASKVSQFVATLPDDVTVELVGLCEYPSEGKKWWKPDGTELSKEVNVRARGRVSASGIPYTVAVKVTMSEGATFEKGEIKGERGGASLEAVDSKGRPISNMRAWMVYIDEKLTEISIQLGIANGPWKTRARNRSRGSVSTAGIVFSKAHESDEGVKITVADEHLDLDYRITAIDTQGKEHLFQQRGGSAGRVRQTTALFHNIKLNQIDYFLFQTRPYQWVTFMNVSLRPGVKTDVQVEVEEYHEQQGTIEMDLKERLQNLVEEFFKHNYRDITARKTIEWGDPVSHENGNISIRYKYEATIWGKDKIIQNRMFTFDKDGKFVSVKIIRENPTGSKAWLQELVEDFFKNNYRDITSRKTLEWGDSFHDKNGNYSIRYKYEATIWGKSKVINDEIFTFDKNGKFFSVKKVGLKDLSFYKDREPNESGISVYQVNRKVSSFPARLDLSKPEYTYVIGKRILADGNDPAWPQISAPELAARMDNKALARRSVKPKVAEKHLNTEIIEVHTKGHRASVIGRIPALIGGYNVRRFKLVDGKWLNIGESGTLTLAGARAVADRSVDYLDFQDRSAQLIDNSPNSISTEANSVRVWQNPDVQVEVEKR